MKYLKYTNLPLNGFLYLLFYIIFYSFQSSFYYMQANKNKNSTTVSETLFI